MTAVNRRISTDTTVYKMQAKKVGTIAKSVANVRNGLNTEKPHLKAPRIDQIFRLYDHLTKLVVEYGEMAMHDLVEFEQISINIETTDSEAR